MLKGKSPSNGFIGKTRFDLLVPMFFRVLSVKFTEEQLYSFINLTIESHDKYITNYGIVTGSDKWKKITTYATGLLEGRKPENPGWVSTGKQDKWPKALTHLRPLYHFVIDNRNKAKYSHLVNEARRLLLTLFKLNRVCTANSTLSALNDLKQKVKLDPLLLKDFEVFARNRLAEIREEITLSDLAFDLFLGPNNGPNGKPKLETASAEAAKLGSDENLYSALSELCVITNNMGFLTFFNKVSKEYTGKLDKILLRKLTSIPDKGNKSRVIAICDFWTQSVLSSIETKIIEVTSSIYKERCCYFSHSEGWKDILSLPQEIQDELVSLDATSWTDNFPAALQFIVMKALFGHKLAEAWYTLAVRCPWFVLPGTSPIYYGKGQGMGTKGSFVIAQLTDLMFIEYCLSVDYKDTSPRYFMKVGDDLVIQDPQMHMQKRYESVGVPVNLTKSKFKTSHGNFIEFVSRNSWNQKDYSIISPALVSKFLRNDHYGPTLFNHIKERSSFNPPSFVEIFDMKKNILLGSAKNPEAVEARTNKTFKLTVLLDILAGTELIPNPTEIWSDVGEVQKLQFLRNLILSLLGNMVHTAVILSQDRATTKARARASQLLHWFEQDESSLRLMDFINSEEINLEEAAHLRTILHMASTSKDKYQRGLTRTLDDQFLLIPGDDAPCTYSLDLDTLKFLFECQDKFESASQGYKTLRRVSLLDRSNTKSVLQLYRYLNNCLKVEDNILDLVTGEYRLPNTLEPKFVTLNPDLVDQYSKLFKFDVMLSQLDSIANEMSTSDFTISMESKDPFTNDGSTNNGV